ncbi:MAG TPA: Crp/Fnr family transcriptional regulator [Membranihabitans sp.]|nr:Crp/Fnr family transcriptional regulator [Membranihabitans sp.]
MKSEILSQVYHHPLIRAEELRRIINAHEKIEFRKGEYFLREGDQADSYMIMETGLMRSFIFDVNGKDITTDFFSQEDLVIEVLSLFQRTPTMENIQALTDTSCWKIDYEVFQDLFHSIEGFTEWGRLWMSNSLFECKQRTLDMVSISAKERYLRLSKEKPEVVLQAPLKHIASYLGITDTSLSRIRKELS